MLAKSGSSPRAVSSAGRGRWATPRSSGAAPRGARPHPRRTRVGRRRRESAPGAMGLLRARGGGPPRPRHRRHHPAQVDRQRRGGAGNRHRVAGRGRRGHDLLQTAPGHGSGDVGDLHAGPARDGPAGDAGQGAGDEIHHVVGRAVVADGPVSRAHLIGPGHQAGGVDDGGCHPGEHQRGLLAEVLHEPAGGHGPVVDQAMPGVTELVGEAHPGGAQRHLVPGRVARVELDLPDPALDLAGRRGPQRRVVQRLGPRRGDVDLARAGPMHGDGSGQVRRGLAEHRPTGGERADLGRGERLAHGVHERDGAVGGDQPVPPVGGEGLERRGRQARLRRPVPEAEAVQEGGVDVGRHPHRRHRGLGQAHRELAAVAGRGEIGGTDAGRTPDGLDPEAPRRGPQRPVVVGHLQRTSRRAPREPGERHSPGQHVGQVRDVQRVGVEIGLPTVGGVGGEAGERLVVPGDDGGVLGRVGRRARPVVPATVLLGHELRHHRRHDMSLRCRRRWRRRRRSSIG